MPKTVYLIGHGRVSNKKEITIPQRTTMHWLAPLGNVTSGLSRALLSGQLNQDYGQSGPGTRILEHYLCGDLDLVHNDKITDFFGNPAVGGQDPFVLFPRKQTSNLRLGSILGFLQKLSPNQDWHVYWTCCRGYLEKVNPMKSQFNPQLGAAEHVLRVNPGPTPKLSDQDHVTTDCDFDTAIFVARSDWAALTARPGRYIDNARHILDSAEQAAAAPPPFQRLSAKDFAASFATRK